MCNASQTRVRWTEQQYFLILAGKDPQELSNRFGLDLQRFSGQRLFFTVPEGTLALLRATGRTFVQVFYVDNTDVQLKTRLMHALNQTARGPLVPVLWQDRAGARLVPRSPAGDQLNAGQQRAFAAMTSTGAYFIWGPPGTGKTKVISAAVADAIRSKRKVLVTSHTHVAVDNVLQKLMSAAYPVGTMIRVAGSSRDRVAEDVVAKGDLLLDQAAAILTRQKERLAAIEIRERAVDAEQADSVFEVARLNAELDGVDLDAIAAAEVSVSARAELVELLVDLRHARGRIEELRERQTAVQRDLDGLDSTKWRREEKRLLAQELQAEENARDARISLSRAGSELKTTKKARPEVAAALERARLDHSRTGNLGRIMGAARRRADRVVQLITRLDETDDKIASAVRAVERADVRLTEATSAWQTTVRELRIASDGLARESDLRERSRNTDAELLAAIQRLAEDEKRKTNLQKLARDSVESLDLLRRADEVGYRRLSAEREVQNARLAGLVQQKAELDIERRRLKDELSRTEQELLRSSPLIACTLTALATQPLLGQRDFDVVIVDEVANANAAAVLYAAAKATRTLALVGDFLQNAPIADADDPVTDADRVIAAWQRDDIFALAKVSSPSDGSTVIFVDTSGMDGYDLVRQGDSWWSPGGVELMVALARRHQPVSRLGRSQLGFVTPYAAHKSRAERRARMESLHIECGTAHTFQGGEVPVLTFDLMQDRRDRWVGVADLNGSRREVSAAKLLNVAVTRMQQKIYLIGDWRYVRTSKRPGMMALAALQNELNFQVISGLDVLNGIIPAG